MLIDGGVLGVCVEVEMSNPLDSVHFLSPVSLSLISLLPCLSLCFSAFVGYLMLCLSINVITVCKMAQKKIETQHQL